MNIAGEDPTWVDVFLTKPERKTNNARIKKGRLRCCLLEF